MKVFDRKESKVVFGESLWMLPQMKFDPEAMEISRTAFCQSNGYQGVRGFLGEEACRDMPQSGTFINDVYEHQTGIVAFIKGKPVLPSVFCRAANAVHYLRMNLVLDGQCFAAGDSLSQVRHLNLQNGDLVHRVLWQAEDGRQTEVELKRQLSLEYPTTAILSLSARPVNYDGHLRFESWLEGDVVSKYLGQSVWVNPEVAYLEPDTIALAQTTHHTEISVRSWARHQLKDPSGPLSIAPVVTKESNRICISYDVAVRQDQPCVLEKIVQIESADTRSACNDPAVTVAAGRDYEDVARSNAARWGALWDACDIQIEGDVKAQQGVRFCMYQLLQAYRAGLDSSVSAKGLTGEGYGLLCFWDAEIYIMPFYLYTQPELARGILMFRYRILDQARQRAKTMGYKGAMFPWMTIEGEDNPAAWECVLGEQFINAVIPYAVGHYVDVTEDVDWLAEYGAEIVLESARFWASRVFFNSDKNQYVISQVTGPDEYTEMVNNNCFTNMMAAWVLRYACKICEMLKRDDPVGLDKLAEKIDYCEDESEQWQDIADRMYVPFDPSLDIHPQDDSFLGLDDLDLNAVPLGQFPLESHLPWPTVLRYKALKQPDVVLASFLLSDQFTLKQKKADYEFYEPITTHDSSLSPSIHSIIASELDKGQDAYDYFLYSTRLDIDYGGSADGIHLANAGGAWMAMVNGFAGMRLINGKLCFDPKLPSCWKGYSFSIKFRGRQLGVSVCQEGACFTLGSGEPIHLILCEEEMLLTDTLEVKTTPLIVEQRKGESA